MEALRRTGAGMNTAAAGLPSWPRALQTYTATPVACEHQEGDKCHGRGRNSGGGTWVRAGDGSGLCRPPGGHLAWETACLFLCFDHYDLKTY